MTAAVVCVLVAGSGLLAPTASNAAASAVVSAVVGAERPSLTVTDYPREANGVDAQLAWAHVADEQGHPSPDVTVAFAGDDPALTLSAPSALTDADGNAVIALTSSTPGSYSVVASVGDQTLSDIPVTATFSTVTPSPTLSTWTLDGASPLTADGVAHYTVRVTALDKHGEPRPDVVVALDCGVGENPGLALAEPVLTDRTGVATLTLSATASVSASLRVTLDGVALPGRQQIRFTADLAGVPSVRTSTWDLRSDGPVAGNGSDYFSSVMTIRDALGNPVPNVTTTYDVDAATGVTAPSSAVTDADGRAVISISSTAPGLASIRAHVGGWSFAPAVAEFAQPSAEPVFTAGASELSISHGALVADGVQEHEASVTVRDSEGDPVSGADVYFRLGRGLSATSPVSVTSDSDGRVRVGVTATTPLRGEISATVNGHTVARAVDSAATTEFVAGPISVGLDGQTSLSLVGGDRAADGVDAHLLLVTAADAQGNPVSDIPITFRAAMGVTLSDETVKTGRDGVASVTATSTTTGRFAVSATADGRAIRDGDQFVDFGAGVPLVGAGSASTVQGGGASVEPDGASRQSVWVTIRDSEGHPVPSVSVDFAADAGASLSAPSAETDGDGVARVFVTATEPGTVAVTASLWGQPIAEAPASVTFAEGAPSAAASTWSVIPEKETVPADGTVAYTGVVTVRDAAGQPVPQVPVDLLVPSAVSARNSTVVTRADGTAEVRLTSRTAGNFSVGAALGGEPVGEAASLIFAPGQPSLGADGVSTSVLAPGSVVAGRDTQRATVTIRDGQGNVVPDVPVTFSADRGVELTATRVETDADGVAWVDVLAASPGTYVLRAEARVADRAQPVGNGALDVTFVSAGASAAHSQLTVSGGGSVVADGLTARHATVTVRDASGDPVSGASVGFKRSAGLDLSAGPYVTGRDGTVSVEVTSRIAETAELSASVAGVVLGEPQSLTYTAGVPSAATSTIDSSRLTVASDGADTAELTVRLRDDAGNTTTARAAVQILTSRGAVTATRSAADGSYTALLTGVTPGAAEASFMLDGVASSSTAAVMLTDAPSAPVIFPSDGNSVAGRAVAGSVIVVTAPDGAPVGSAEVDATGHFVVALGDATARGDLSHGDVLRAVAWGRTGLSSAPSPAVVDAAVPDSPRVEVTDGSRLVASGLGRGDSLRVFAGDGTPVPGATRLEWGGTGTFTPDSPLEQSAAPYVTVMDAVGNQSAPVEVDFGGQQSTARAATPRVEPTEGTSVLGSLPGTVEAAVMVLGPDGAFLGANQVGPESTFAVRLADTVAVGDSVTVIAVDAAGVLSRSVPLRVGTPSAAVVDEPVYQLGVGTQPGPTVQGRGFQPGEAVIVVSGSGSGRTEVHSADINGTVSIPVTIPLHAAPGSYSVSLLGAVSGEVVAPYEVSGNGGGLAVTGAADSALLAVWALLLVASGLGLTWRKVATRLQSERVFAASGRRS